MYLTNSYNGHSHSGVVLDLVDCARTWRGRDESDSGQHSAACSLAFSPHFYFSSVLCDSTADNSSWLQRGTGTGTGTGIGTINAPPSPPVSVAVGWFQLVSHYRSATTVPHFRHLTQKTEDREGF